MITYENAKFHPRFLFKLRGSVMPFSVLVALPCALLAVGIKLGVTHYSEGGIWEFLGIEKGTDQVASAAFSGMNFLIGFLVVFRAQQAYSRFWEGCTAITTMQGLFFDAASSLTAFCKMSAAPAKEVVIFQHTLMRLTSLLNASVLMELSESNGVRQDLEDSSAAGSVRPGRRAFELELIDAEGLDSQSLLVVNSTRDKVELLFQWIQQLIVESHNKRIFSVEAPILSRAFQELAEGMVTYRQALKIANIPLPFPYVQATELLLTSHWLLSPFLMCIWTVSPVWTGMLTFVQVAFFWSLNSIATELENPFGEDANDLNAEQMQRDFNKQLLLLMRPSTGRTARLSQKAALAEVDATEDPRNPVIAKVSSMMKGGAIQTSDIPRWLRRRSSLEKLMDSYSSLGDLQTNFGGILERSFHEDSEHEEEDQTLPHDESDHGAVPAPLRDGGSAGPGGDAESLQQACGHGKGKKAQEKGLEACGPGGLTLKHCTDGSQAKFAEATFGSVGPLSSEPKRQSVELLGFCEELRDRLSALQPDLVHLHLACLPELLEVGKDLREHARVFASHTAPFHTSEHVRVSASHTAPFYTSEAAHKAQGLGDLESASRRMDDRHITMSRGKDLDGCSSFRNWITPAESPWSQRTSGTRPSHWRMHRAERDSLTT